LKQKQPKLPEKPQDSTLLAYAENLVGTTLGVLGAVEYLRGPRKPVQPLTDPPLSAMELLRKGEQYTSGRALYNLGVAYDRQKDKELAREYYKRASDLGHPLATYNYGIIILREGQIKEGLELMKFSAARGVREAQAVIKDLTPAAKP
jgi:TPR repeat protein